MVYVNFFPFSLISSSLPSILRHLFQRLLLLLLVLVLALARHLILLHERNIIQHNQSKLNKIVIAAWPDNLYASVHV